MNIKKNRKAGVCIAMRCKEPSTEGGPYCTRHEQEAAAPSNENVLDLVSRVPQATPLVEVQLEAETVEATEAYALAESFQITTQDELVFAAEIVKDAKGSYNRLEEQKQEILRPLTESVKRIRTLFAPAQEYYSAIEGAIKLKIAAAHRAQAENNARALAEAQAQVDAGAEPVALAEVQHIGNVEGLQVRQVWDFEIVDEETIDRLLLAPALDKIRMFMRECVADGGVPEAAGIRFFQKDVVAARAR